MGEKKANIYIDCEGNVETDVYFKESNIPQLKEFLSSLGYGIDFVGPYEDSIELKKPFIDKPSIIKTITHDIDCGNFKVIFKILEDKFK